MKATVKHMKTPIGIGAAISRAERQVQIRPFGPRQWIIRETRDEWDYWTESHAMDRYRALANLRQARFDRIEEDTGLLGLAIRCACNPDGPWTGVVRYHAKQMARPIG